MTEKAAEPGRHVHDDVDWAAMAGALGAWDDLETGRNRAIVEWLGVASETWWSMSGRELEGWRRPCSMPSESRAP